MNTEVSEADETVILVTVETPKLREALREIVHEQATRATSAAWDGRLGGYYTRSGQLAMLIGILKTTEESQPVPGVTHPGVQRALRYLHEHFRERMSLSMRAARSHLSRSHLTHLFKQQIGQSVTAYVTALRIQRAKALLPQSRMSIAEISEEIGFHDAGRFTKVFRRREGILPSRYRQEKHKTTKE